MAKTQRTITQFFKKETKANTSNIPASDNRARKRKRDFQIKHSSSEQTSKSNLLKEGNHSNECEQPAAKRQRPNPKKQNIAETKPDHAPKPLTLEYSTLRGMTVRELKALCESKGLKVGGNKTALIRRLLNPNSVSAKSKGGYSAKRVNAMLAAVGVEKPETVSCCLKRGIQRGYIVIDADGKGLDTVICNGTCLCCSKKHSATIRDCLYQSDYGGNDYEDGGKNGAIQCDDCMGLYVTGLCEGEPAFDSGKFHNHSTECPGFGKCIGDYRSAHCSECRNYHYWAGFMGNGNCDRCNRGDDCLIQ